MNTIYSRNMQIPVRRIEEDGSERSSSHYAREFLAENTDNVVFSVPKKHHSLSRREFLALYNTR